MAVDGKENLLVHEPGFPNGCNAVAVCKEQQLR
jgi:hypothetical protein